MPDREPSFQRLDPAGADSARSVSVLVAALALVYALLATALTWRADAMPVFALLATACVVGATVMIFRSTSALRAPFSGTAFAIVMSLDVLAAVLVRVGAPTAGWGPVVIGVTILLLGPYRPPRDLLAATILAAIAVGFLAAVATPTGSITISISETMIPLLALGLAGVTYGVAIARIHAATTERTRRATLAAAEASREEVVRSVQQNRVSILSLEVVPFLGELLSRGTIRRQDGRRAATLAEEIRSVMVADVDRSWLDVVVDQADRLRTGELPPGSETIQDHERLAGGMLTAQRTALRAFVFALFERPGFDPDGFAMALTREGVPCVVDLTAKLDGERSFARTGLAPFIAALRVEFSQVDLSFESPTVTLRFCYEHK